MSSPLLLGTYECDYAIYSECCLSTALWSLARVSRRPPLSRWARGNNEPPCAGNRNPADRRPSHPLYPPLALATCVTTMDQDLLDSTRPHSSLDSINPCRRLALALSRRSLVFSSDSIRSSIYAYDLSQSISLVTCSLPSLYRKIYRCVNP